MSAMRLRQLVGPAYLLACLLFGGSTQNVWFTAALQLSAVAILGWAVIERPTEPLTRDAQRLIVLAAALLGLVTLHLVPLPPSVWQNLPGRGLVSQGLKQLGLAPGWQPLSLVPYDTITTSLTLLPPFAMLSAMLVLRAFTRPGIAVALFLGAALGLALGRLQINGSEVAERFYLQPEHNPGTASGFFANPDHMATLLLITLPFVTALAGWGLDMFGRQSSRGQAGLLLGGAGALLILIGVILNGSLAGLGLSIPVVVLSVLMLVRPPRWVRTAMFAAATIACLAYIVVVATPLNRLVPNGHAASSIATRQEFFATGLRVAADYFPVGSGIGTFVPVYRIREDVRKIDLTVYVNHAHDDYLELLIETGLPGVALLMVFFLWWGSVVLRLMRTPDGDLFARAGAIASLVIFIHSIVDYPLRTSAIAVSFAMALSLLVLPKLHRSSAETELRPTRHVKID